MLNDMPTLSSGIDLMAKTYSAEELKSLRRREKHTLQMRERLVQNVLLLAAQFFKEHPSVTEWPTGPEVRNTFIFRYALCGYVSILKRIEDGGAGKTKPEKLRNDVIDVNFAAFATYFDGLITSDKRARETYAEAEFLLREAFAMPPWWLRVLLSIGGRSQPPPFTRRAGCKGHVAMAARAAAPSAKSSGLAMNCVAAANSPAVYALSRTKPKKCTRWRTCVAPRTFVSLLKTPVIGCLSQKSRYCAATASAPKATWRRS
jgi:hypothetical protein